MTLPADRHEGQTALGFAAPECADAMVRRLLDAGASPDALDENGAPVLAGAARNGCPEVVEMLMARR
jgi:ankyrin repeat protein